LERYPGARVGGRWSLQELGAFARQNGLDEADFLRELATAAGVSVERRGKPVRGGAPTALVFTAVAIGLTLGAGWGATLLLRIGFGVDYAAAPGASVHVHGVAQLWGWMALFVFAVGAHLLRQSTKRPAPAWLTSVAGGLVVAALLAMFAGLFGADGRSGGWIGVVASGLLSAAAACFAVSAGWSLAGRGQRPQLWHGFVLAAVVWLLAWAAADLTLRVRHAGSPVLPDDARNLLIALPVFGFATNAIYGFGTRLIPGLLNIGHLWPRWFAVALVTHNAGLLLLLTPGRGGTHVIGSGAMLAAACAYLVGMDGTRGKPSRPIYGVDPRGHVLIRVAFAWLVVGLAMVFAGQVFPGLPHAYQGAWRHALTVGFVTTMILGVGQRVVPVFVREPLASTGMMRAGAALILVGNAGRVGLELLTIGQWPWAFRLMGVTGLLELAALALFGLNLAMTVRNRGRTYAAGEPLTPGVRVREAVNARPEIQQRLHELGVTMLDNAPFVAPSLTFGAMALAWGREPERLIDELNRAEGSGGVVGGDSSRVCSTATSAASPGL
jgi:hypothetical protein